MLRGKKVNLFKGKQKTSSPVMDVGIHNKFDIEVIDAKTGKIKEKAVGYNTICSNLWKHLTLSGTNYANYIHFGEGSGTPSPDDTALFSYLGYKAVTIPSNSYTIDYENGIFSQQYTIQLLETEYNNKFITEVGIAYSSSSELCTHAMLLDMNGNPISIQKTSSDIINIYATVYVHFNPYGYDNGHIFLFLGTSVNSSYLGRFAGRNNSSVPSITDYVRYFKAAGGRDVRQEGSTNGSVTLEQSNYDDEGGFELTAARLTADQGNNGGIRGMIVYGTNTYFGTTTNHNRGIFIKAGGAGIPFTEVTNEPIGTGDGERQIFNTTFPFPKNAKIYVDGVDVTNNKIYNTSEFIASPSSSTNSEGYYYTYDRRETIGTNLTIVNVEVAYSSARDYETLPSEQWNYDSSSGVITVSAYSTTNNGFYFRVTYTEGGCNVYYTPNTTNITDYVELIRPFSKPGQHVSDVRPTSYYTELIFYNPMWDQGGINTIVDSYKGLKEIYCSNDLSTWTPVTSPIDTTYKGYKYWKVVATAESLISSLTITANFDNAGSNIYFFSPPDSGAVITATYTPECIAKDANHVFDLSIYIDLGEYVNTDGSGSGGSDAGDFGYTLRFLHNPLVVDGTDTGEINTYSGMKYSLDNGNSFNVFDPSWDASDGTKALAIPNVETIVFKNETNSESIKSTLVIGSASGSQDILKVVPGQTSSALRITSDTTWYICVLDEEME